MCPLAKPAEFGVFQRHSQLCCRVSTHVHGCPDCLTSIFVSVVSGLQHTFILSSGFGYFFHLSSSYLRVRFQSFATFPHCFCFNSFVQHNSPSMTPSPCGSCSLMVLLTHMTWLDDDMSAWVCSAALYLATAPASLFGRNWKTSWIFCSNRPVQCG